MNAWPPVSIQLSAWQHHHCSLQQKVCSNDRKLHYPLHSFSLLFSLQCRFVGFQLGPVVVDLLLGFVQLLVGLVFGIVQFALRAGDDLLTTGFLACGLYLMFDTYSLSFRISLLICINDGILVYHLFFFRSFYVLHNCSLLFHISLFKAFQRSLRLPRAPPLNLPLAKDSSCRCAFVLSNAPFFGAGTAKVVTYFLLTKFAVRKVPFPRLIHPPLPLSQPALRHAWQNPYF